MPNEEGELRALLEWARVERLKTPAGFFVAGTIAGTSKHVGGGREVVDRLIERTSPGDVLLISCPPLPDPHSLSARLAGAGLTCIVGTDHPHAIASARNAPAPSIEFADSDLGADFWRLNEANAFSHRVGRPLVVAKMATSIDGRIATRTGQSKWITGAEARTAGHFLRRRSGAILVGKNTATADNPTLTARLSAGPDGPNPVRVVISTRPSLPVGSSLRDIAVAATTVFHAAADPVAETELERSGIEVRRCEGPDGRVDLGEALSVLHEKGIEQVLIEGGGELIGSFADAGLIDRVVHFRAPMILGGAGARPCVGGVGIDQLGTAIRGWRTEVRMVGADVELTTDFALELRPPTCEGDSAG